jgi:hypothetical protein
MKHLAFALAVLGAASAASADVPQNPAPNGPNDLLNPQSIVEGAGVRVGEGTVLHPIVGLETGFVSNVFYEDVGANASGLLRLMVELQTGTLPPERMQIAAEDATDPAQQAKEQGSFQYDFRGYATWDQYLSTNDAVTSQGGLGGGLLLKGLARPNAPLNFSFMDWYSRLLRPTNFESSSNTNRDINRVVLQLNYQPRGRTLSGYLYFQDTVDYFEQDQQHFANRLQNLLGVRAFWQMLPLTRIYIDLSQGVYSGLGSDSTKVDSYPLTAVAGLQTAFTLNTTFNVRVGYTKGFYSSGPDYGTIVGGAELGYRYSPVGRVTAMYSYDLQDSINANFYRDHGFMVTLDHAFDPFLLFIRPEMHLRTYEGVSAPGIMPTSPTRNDTIFAITAGGRYVLRNWLAATLDYSFASVQTDFRYMTDGITENPSYTRHELLAGLRAAY